MQVKVKIEVIGPEVDAVFGDEGPCAEAIFDGQPSGAQMQAMWDIFKNALVEEFSQYDNDEEGA